MSCLDNRNTVSDITIMQGEEEFLETSDYEEKCTVSVSHVPISLVSSVGPSNFTVWAAQGQADNYLTAGATSLLVVGHNVTATYILRSNEQLRDNTMRGNV